MRWSSARMDQLERAVRDGLRIAVTRRGSEHVLIAKKLTTVEGRDAVVALVPMSGQELTFLLDDIESFQIFS